jgi:diguanylate cyclase (GGDEF)-like protein
MKKLLRDLSYLSGLRDRQAMDFALVRLIAHSALWHFNAVRLLRAVGAPDDQRWVTLGKLDDQHSQPERDQFWFDVSTLPRLADFPKREAAIVTESVVRSGSGPFTTVFPIDTQASVCSLLEVDSTDAVSADTEVLIDSVLHLYENLQGMLDYGERDTLTELLNRKTFDGAFLRAAQVQDSAQELDMPDRRATPAAAGYWLAVIDIDHFKNVNDSFGHLIGDEVLLLLARQMRSNFRFYDQLYRFGGEEFVVLMRCAGHTDALAALERFRGLIEAHAFPQIGHITISIGFAPLRDNDTPSGAFDRADKAVYHAKTHGRNQVCSFTALVEAGELPEQSDGIEDIDYF